jgi:hypothetical protein
MGFLTTLYQEVNMKFLTLFKCAKSNHKTHFLNTNSTKGLAEGSCLCGKNKFSMPYSDFVTIMKQQRVINNKVFTQIKQ